MIFAILLCMRNICLNFTSHALHTLVFNERVCHLITSEIHFLVCCWWYVPMIKKVCVTLFEPQIYEYGVIPRKLYVHIHSNYIVTTWGFWSDVSHIEQLDFYALLWSCIDVFISDLICLLQFYMINSLVAGRFPIMNCKILICSFKISVQIISVMNVRLCFKIKKYCKVVRIKARLEDKRWLGISLQIKFDLRKITCR